MYYVLYNLSTLLAISTNIFLVFSFLHFISFLQYTTRCEIHLLLLQFSMMAFAFVTFIHVLHINIINLTCFNYYFHFHFLSLFHCFYSIFSIHTRCLSPCLLSIFLLFFLFLLCLYVDFIIIIHNSSLNADKNVMMMMRSYTVISNFQIIPHFFSSH